VSNRQGMISVELQLAKLAQGYSIRETWCKTECRKIF